VSLPALNLPKARYADGHTLKLPEKTPKLLEEIRPFKTFHLDVGDGHEVYVEISGNPKGQPAVMLHGGPGSGLNPQHRKLFDPARFMLVQFDQRGCGNSLPHGALQANTTAHLVGDIDKIRRLLGIERWEVAGGSWGSTLALAYAEAFPHQVRSLTLYGIFLGRQRELEALYFKGGIASRLFPEMFEDFLGELAKGDRDDPIAGYGKLFASADPVNRAQALRQWTRLEKQCSQIFVDQTVLSAELDDDAYVLSHSLIENYYFQNNCFIDGDALIAKAKHFLDDVPVTLINGRYDIVTPPETAYELASAVAHAHLVIVDGAGHSAKEPGIRQALLQATSNI